MAEAVSGPLDDPREAELRALRRLRELDSLLPTLTGVLDLRDVFDKVSEIARRALPHDLLVVVLVDEDEPEWVRVYATAGELPADPPERLPTLERPRSAWDHKIVADLAAEPDPTVVPAVVREAAAHGGLHAWLRVPIRLEGEDVGDLSFLSKQTGLYGPADVIVAKRVRDHLALAISHQRLAAARERLLAERDRATRAEVRAKLLTDELVAAGGYGRVVGDSKPWKAAVTQLLKVAPTETTVLVTGESGTGKEVVARLIHGASRRAAGPFVAINCAALPENLLESELFGFEKGAFSGAAQAKPGRIEVAAGGTLFLDEIGEMSLVVQAKLLRFLEQREFQRLGGAKTLKADVRVVAATNRDLQGAIARGELREDLYYRISVFEIRTPPLRERSEDIIALADSFLADFGRSLGRPPAGLSRDARQRLMGYRWPGNVRELRNVLERASILCEGGLITGEHLNIADPVVPARPPQPAAPAAKTALASADSSGGDLASVERATIERALAEVRYNKTLAAKRLGISRAQLYLRLRKHGLVEDDDGAREPE